MKKQFNNLMIFENNSVEIFELRGQVLFNPYDVGKCLDLTDSAVRKAINKMSLNQAIKLKHSIVKDFPNLDIPTSGKLFLTEQGVYKLAFQSNKLEAEKFANWVFDEVLPSIRKHGAYIDDNTSRILKQNPNYIENLLNELNDTKAKIRETNKALVYYDALGNAEGSISMGEFSKMLQNSIGDIGRNRLLKFLRDNKILQKDNAPYQKYIKYFKVIQGYYLEDNKVKLKTITRIRPKGEKYLLKFILKKMKKSA